MRQPPVKRMIEGSIPSARAKLETMEIPEHFVLFVCVLAYWGSANGRLPDFESGDEGSNPSPRTFFIPVNQSNEDLS